MEREYKVEAKYQWKTIDVGYGALTKEGTLWATCPICGTKNRCRTTPKDQRGKLANMCKHFEAFRFLPNTPTIKERCVATFRGEINGLKKLLKLLK